MSDQGVMTTPIFDELASEIGIEIDLSADEPRAGEEQGRRAG